MKNSYERLLSSGISHRKELSIVLDELGFVPKANLVDMGIASFVKSIATKSDKPSSVIVCVDLNRNPGETKVYLTDNIPKMGLLCKNHLGYDIEKTYCPPMPYEQVWELKLANLQNKEYQPEINYGFGLVLDDILAAYGILREGMKIRELKKSKKRVDGKVIPQGAERIKRFKEEFYSVQH